VQRIWRMGLLLALVAMSVNAQQAATLTDTPLSSKQLTDQKGILPKQINSPQAEYPDDARQRRINGRCVVWTTVDITGMPRDLKLAHCSDLSFARSSLDAATRYRFKPATTADGKPVTTRIFIEINYRIDGGSSPVMPIRFSFSSPPGLSSSEPSSDGVYPLTKLATPPSMRSFSDENFSDLAFSSLSNGICNIALTISEKGTPSDPQVIHCESPALEQPAIKSLLKSRYKPGKVNGKAVPMRTAILLELADLPSN
jgi:TonB family protein